jgi:hypothetical protein
MRFEAARNLTHAASELRSAAAKIDFIVTHMADTGYAPHPSRPNTPVGDAVRDALSVYRRMDVLSWIDAAFGAAMEADHERRISEPPKEGPDA